MKILIILNSALNVSHIKSDDIEGGNKRVKQYVDGFKKFFEFDFKSNVDIVISDNTISNKSQIDERILKILSNKDINYDIKDDNKYGSLNKGAGVLTSWLRLSKDIINYDYVIHFEPRLLINNFSFFENFFNSPRTLITLGSNKKHFNTGLFAAESKWFTSYINSTTPEIITKTNESLEYSIYNYVIHNNIDFDTQNKMCAFRYDAKTGITKET